jgi:glycosyltransferase involved in cell wall biosynthesis/UDP-N-acetyl-D-mannosaminuronic acid transferase (WecB/TagA/CpsF family)
MLNILINGLFYKRTNSEKELYLKNISQNLATYHKVYILVYSKYSKDFKLIAEDNENIIIIKLSSFWKSDFFRHNFLLPYICDKFYDILMLANGEDALFNYYPIYTIAVFHGELSDSVTKHNIKQFSSSIDKVNKIVSTSKYNYKKLLSNFPEYMNKAQVLYPGYNEQKFNERIIVDKGAIKIKYNLKKPFILYIADIVHPENNHINIIKAYDNLSEEIKNRYDLIFVGKAGKKSEEVIQHTKHAARAKRIKFLTVPDKTIPALYKIASLYIQGNDSPEARELVMQAMACGTPVITISNSILNETIGAAAYSCNVSDIKELTTHLGAVLGFELEQKSMSKSGLKQVERFSWDTHISRFVFSFYNKINQQKYSEYKKELLAPKVFHHLKNICSYSTAMKFRAVSSFLILISIVLPVFILLLFRKLIFNIDIFYKEEFYITGIIKKELTLFNHPKNYIKKLSLLYYTMKGELNFVGAPIYDISEVEDAKLDYLYNIKSGLITPTLFTDALELTADKKTAFYWEFFKKQTIKHSLYSLAKALPALLAIHKQKTINKTFDIFDNRVNNFTDTELFDELLPGILSNNHQVKILISRAENFYKLKEENSISVYDHILPVNKLFLFLSYIIDRPIKKYFYEEKLISKILQFADENKHSVFLIGENLGTLKYVSKTILRRMPELNLFAENYASGASIYDIELLVEKINMKSPDIIIFSSEVIKAEEWLEVAAEKINSKLIIAGHNTLKNYSELSEKDIMLRELLIGYIKGLATNSVETVKKILTSIKIIFAAYRWKIRGIKDDKEK